MTRFTVALLLVVATALVLRWRRPAWYWLTFGVSLALLRVAVRYSSVMDACGLTVPRPAGAWRSPGPPTAPCRGRGLPASCACGRPEPAWCCD